jgi:carboxymethylenebutenolidase
MQKQIKLANGLEGVLFVPKSGVGSATVVIFHERYGLVQHTLDLAQKLADDGYVAFAPNLFAQWEGDIKAVNEGKARAFLPDAECTRITNLAIDMLVSDVRTTSGKLFLMGVCQSGRYPIVVASQRNDISACLVIYGASHDPDWTLSELQPTPMPEMFAKVSAPSLFIYGEADHVISMDNVRRVRDTLETHRKSYRMRVFPDAPHGFLNDTMPGRYRPCETKLTWEMVLAFMQEVSQGQWPADRVRWEFNSESSPDYDFAANVRLE